MQISAVQNNNYSNAAFKGYIPLKVELHVPGMKKGPQITGEYLTHKAYRKLDFALKSPPSNKKPDLQKAVRGFLKIVRASIDGLNNRRFVYYNDMGYILTGADAQAVTELGSNLGRARTIHGWNSIEAKRASDKYGDKIRDIVTGDGECLKNGTYPIGAVIKVTDNGKPGKNQKFKIEDIVFRYPKQPL